VNRLRIAVLLLGTSALPRSAPAQGYRLRIDTRAQAVAYRGVQFDSIPVSDTVTGPTGGPTTRDGFAVSCFPGSAHCTFFRPGPEQHARPVTSNADLTVWGLGMPGLSIRATARLGGSLGSADAWPGADPTTQLLEGYAQYAVQHFTLQLGRQTMTTRLGFTGFDGSRVTARTGGLELSGYGGWGLWRGSVLPVTSPALNPLGEFRPPKRTLIAGAGAGWTMSRLDIRLAYQREVDPSVDYFVSERAGVNAAVRPYRGVSLSGGADYDIAQGWWGSAEATLAYAAPNSRVNATAGVRRYRPYFDLWTIWGAFAPVPYTAFDGSLAVTPIRRLQLRASGEHYSFADAAAATPLVNVETDGWRFSWGGTYTLPPKLTVEGGYHAEFGPGASSRGFEGRVTYSPAEFLALGLRGGTLDRPLELRFDESSVRTYGVYARYQPSSRVRGELDVSRYAEDRKRPDAAAFSWDQLRASARVVVSFGSGAELRGLPPAVQRMPRSAGGGP
jgi:hypothetical protein